MTPYLEEKGNKVYHMLEFQLRLEDAMRVSKAEGFAEGVAKGMAKVFLAIDYLREGRTIEETATLTGLSEDKVKKLSDTVRR
jgi:hypothetical protein